jgi:hypothetical protein
LEVGRRYTYQVYDGETQSIATVTQEILAYEESDLFTGKGFKVRTRFHGQEATTWIDAEGKPLLELAQGGVIISALETEEIAREYLAQAALNRKESLLDFSLIKTDTPIAAQDRISSLELILRGIDPDMAIPTDERQQCQRLDQELVCRIHRERLDPVNQNDTTDSTHLYLQPTHTVPSRHQLISNQAKEIAGQAKTDLERIRLLLAWIEDNIRRQPLDVFTALDVLQEQKAECQGHSYLYTAFARSLEIPTRVVNGIVYSTFYEGFLYHAWAESLVAGRWIAVDPTLGQLPADATHLKFVEGESPLDLLPLANLIGKLQVEIISIEE